MKTLQRSVLVFLFLFFLFHILEKLISSIFNPFILWTGDYVFNIDYFFEKKGYGSGDNTYSYLYLFVSFILSIFGTLIYLTLFKNRNINKFFLYYFLLSLRLYLIFYMLIYGLGKVVSLQFPPISNYRLLQTYGESSPMGLAWTFMQYSPYYSAFSGFVEVIGALLLLNRKTITLGAFILTGVLSNIVMMNFCYDIPVKISSSYYLLASLIILFSDYKSLLKFISIEREMDMIKIPSNFSRQHQYIFSLVFKSLFLFLVLSVFSTIYFSSKSSNKNTSILSGLYKIKYHIINSDTLYKPNDEKLCWKNIVIEDNRAAVRYINDSTDYFHIKIDTIKRKISFERMNLKDKKNKNIYYYEIKSPQSLLLYNNIYRDSSIIYLQKQNRSDFKLINRGFNWINEKPFNK
jgi:hypothetical protein